MVITHCFSLITSGGRGEGEKGGWRGLDEWQKSTPPHLRMLSTVSGLVVPFKVGLFQEGSVMWVGRGAHLPRKWGVEIEGWWRKRNELIQWKHLNSVLSAAFRGMWALFGEPKEVAVLQIPSNPKGKSHQVREAGDIFLGVPRNSQNTTGQMDWIVGNAVSKTFSSVWENKV